MRRPTISTRTYTLFPFTTLFRSGLSVGDRRLGHRRRLVRHLRLVAPSAPVDHRSDPVDHGGRRGRHRRVVRPPVRGAGRGGTTGPGRAPPQPPRAVARGPRWPSPGRPPATTLPPPPPPPVP